MDANANIDNPQPPDGLPDTFSVDETIQLWTRAMTKLARDDNEHAQRIARLEAHVAAQTKLIDLLDARLRALEASAYPRPQIGGRA